MGFEIVLWDEEVYKINKFWHLQRTQDFHLSRIQCRHLKLESKRRALMQKVPSVQRPASLQSVRVPSWNQTSVHKNYESKEIYFAFSCCLLNDIDEPELNKRPNKKL